LVTGAAGNVGRAVCHSLAARGWSLALLDRAAAPLEALAADLPGAGERLVVPDVDLTDPAACAAAIGRVMQRFGRLDGVAHTVGGFAATAIDAASPADWEAMFRINLLTTANVLAAALGAMRQRRGGAIVAIGALAGLRAPGGMAPYAAAKAGVLRLVEAAAEEARPFGIRVNAVLPGTLDTPQNRAAMQDADPSAWVAPAALAEAIAFLLSDAARAINGVALPVPGGG
jgi:NAD(P)-dependent dehydrogenase (short-subunit alcohol dehydrogenase family)